MRKKIIYKHHARQALELGIDTLAKAVGVTLGPKGKNVILDRKLGTPQIVNDGVTIAQEIELSDSLENVGVSLVRQAALKTNDVVGDGTTTSTILAHAIVKEGIKSISMGSNPLLIKRGIEKAVQFVVNKIVEYARPVSDIEDVVNIASISAGNNHMVGRIIASAINQVGREGILSLEEGQSTTTSLQVIDGMSFNKGYISPYFLSNSTESEVRQKNPFVLLTDKKINNAQKELIPLLEEVALTARPLFIMAEDIEREALSTLILNKVKGIVDVVAVRIPGIGDAKQAFLEDIAVLTNATIISDKIGLSLKNTSLSMMGSAKSMIVSKDMTTIVSDINQEAVNLRCTSLKKQIELSVNSYEKQKLQDRLAKLSGGIAIIKLGAYTEVEMIENKLRFEDAIHATKAALEEGIIPGGGAALLHLSSDLNSWAKKSLVLDEYLGAEIIMKALLTPLFTILDNAGINGPLVVESLRGTSFEIGYDAEKYKIVNMYSVGIIDPAKVTRLALQNASSIACIVLTTECLVSDIP